MSVDIFEMAFMENKKLSDADETKANTVKKVNKALSESKLNKRRTKMIKESNDDEINKSELDIDDEKEISDEGCSKKSKKKIISANKIKFTEDVDDIDIQSAEGIVVVYSDDIKP